MNLRTNRRGQWSGMSRRANMVTAQFWPYYADGASIGNRSNAAAWQENSDMAMAMLAANSGHIWFVSDAGASGNKFMAQRISDGAARGVWTLEQALDAAADFEAIASALLGGVAYLYIGDIGDNSDNRATFNIYRCKEPTITGSDGTQLDINTEKIVCAYPGGNPPTHNDAETLLVDPDNGDMYVITKRDATASCYVLRHAGSYSGTQTLTYLGPIWTPASITDNANANGTGGYYTGGAINMNGDIIALRNYLNIYMFQRKPRQPIYNALTVAGVDVPAYNQPGIWRATVPTPNCDEPQGEGICFDSSDNLYTCSEYIAAQGHSATEYPTFKFNRVQGVVTETAFQDGVAPTAGYAGTLNTYIWSLSTEQSLTQPHAPNALDTFVADYNSATDERYGLLYFDISAIPTTATVVGAELILYINTEGLAFKLYKMYMAWTESSTFTSLTRLPAFDDVDAASAHDVSLTGWSNALIGAESTGTCRLKIPVATIQSWVTTPASNKGWVVYSLTDGNGFQFRARNYATAANRPRLVVRWR